MLKDDDPLVIAINWMLLPIAIIIWTFTLIFAVLFVELRFVFKILTNTEYQHNFVKDVHEITREIQNNVFSET